MLEAWVNKISWVLSDQSAVDAYLVDGPLVLRAACNAGRKSMCCASATNSSSNWDQPHPQRDSVDEEWQVGAPPATFMNRHSLCVLDETTSGFRAKETPSQDVTADSFNTCPLQRMRPLHRQLNAELDELWAAKTRGEAAELRSAIDSLQESAGDGDHLSLTSWAGEDGAPGSMSLSLDLEWPEHLQSSLSPISSKPMWPNLNQVLI